VILRLSNTVVFLAFLCGKTRLMFLVVIFFKFDFIQESGSDMKFAIEYLCKDIPIFQGISSKIRENFDELEQQVQVTLRNYNYTTLPQEDKE